MNENSPDPGASGSELLNAIGEAGYQDGMQVHGEGVEVAAEAAEHGAEAATQAGEAVAHAAGEHAPEATDTITQVVAWVMHHVTPLPHHGEAWSLFPGISVPLPSFMHVHYVMLILAAVFLLAAFLVFYKHSARVPSGFTNLLEFFVKFIRDDICIPSFGEEDGRKQTPMFATFFFFILTMNIMGLIPIFSTATGNLHVTLGLSTLVFALMTIGGIIAHRNPVEWFKAFVPHGVPAPVLLVIVPLELIGLVVKSFALAMRLFANMLAGHIVLFSFIGMSVAFGAIGLPAAGLAIGVYFLEIFVAFLQAYVFTLLAAIFVGQVYHPAH